MTLRLAGHDVRFDNGAVVSVDGTPLEVTAAALAVLLRLARDPGAVVDPDDLLEVLPSGGTASRHAVEVTVGRLRAALGDPRIVQTVVKRGYRLAID